MLLELLLHEVLEEVVLRLDRPAKVVFAHWALVCWRLPPNLIVELATVAEEAGSAPL